VFRCPLNGKNIQIRGTTTGPILNQTNPVLTAKSYLFKVHYIILYFSHIHLSLQTFLLPEDLRQTFLIICFISIEQHFQLAVKREESFVTAYSWTYEQHIWWTVLYTPLLMSVVMVRILTWKKVFLCFVGCGLALNKILNFQLEPNGRSHTHDYISTFSAASHPIDVVYGDL